MDAPRYQPFGPGWCGPRFGICSREKNRGGTEDSQAVVWELRSDVVNKSKGNLVAALTVKDHSNLPHRTGHPARMPELTQEAFVAAGLSIFYYWKLRMPNLQLTFDPGYLNKLTQTKQFKEKSVVIIDNGMIDRDEGTDHNETLELSNTHGLEAYQARTSNPIATTVDSQHNVREWLAKAHAPAEKPIPMLNEGYVHKAKYKIITTKAPSMTMPDEESKAPVEYVQDPAKEEKDGVPLRKFNLNKNFNSSSEFCSGKQKTCCIVAMTGTVQQLWKIEMALQRKLIETLVELEKSEDMDINDDDDDDDIDIISGITELELTGNVATNVAHHQYYQEATNTLNNE